MNNGGTLAAGHTTSVTLTNATNFPTSGTVLIGTELITYANKAGNVLQTLTLSLSIVTRFFNKARL